MDMCMYYGLVILLVWVSVVVTLVLDDVSTKLEVSVAFLFREHRRDGMNGWTDGRTDIRGATLNAAPREVALSITFQLYTVSTKKTVILYTLP